MTIAEMQQLAFECSRDHGFHDGETSADSNMIGTKLALIHSEVSEALEEIRTANENAFRSYRDAKGKPEGFVTELADAVIRIGDLCGWLDSLGYKVDLEKAVTDKMAFNLSRPFKHGRRF